MPLCKGKGGVNLHKMVQVQDFLSWIHLESLRIYIGRKLLASYAISDLNVSFRQVCVKRRPGRG
jgi:hypothetical protein